MVNRLTGGVDEFFGRTDSAGTTFPLTDALGSTIALTDTSGSVQTQYTYDPFGGTTASGATSSNTYQFTGRVNDGTGLYYYRARYYSPRFQRFVSEDPLGFAGRQINLYTYTGNNPINGRDPFGLTTVNIGINASGSIGEAAGTVSAGIVADSNGNVAGYFTYGGGAAVNTGASGSVSVTGGASSASTVCGFKGPFFEYGANAGYGEAGGASWYTGVDSHNVPVVGYSGSLGWGGGAEAYEAITITRVKPFFGRKTTCQ